MSDVYEPVKPIKAGLSVSEIIGVWNKGHEKRRRAEAQPTAPPPAMKATSPKPPRAPAKKAPAKTTKKAATPVTDIATKRAAKKATPKKGGKPNQ